MAAARSIQEALVDGEALQTIMDYQYLLPSSDHHPHVHKYLPYGSLGAIVSDDTRHRLSELTAFLTACGYSKPAMEEQLDRVDATEASIRHQPHCPILYLEHSQANVFGVEGFVSNFSKERPLTERL